MLAGQFLMRCESVAEMIDWCVYHMPFGDQRFLIKQQNYVSNKQQCISECICAYALQKYNSRLINNGIGKVTVVLWRKFIPMVSSIVL